MQAIDSQRATHIDVIDGLRGVAILAVIFFHTLPDQPIRHWHATWFNGIQVSPLTWLLHSGYQGVVLFFILSGFVLTLPYALGIRTMETSKDVFSFYGRRARRLLPLYFINVILLTTLVVPTASPGKTLQMLLPLVTLTFQFFESTRSPAINGVLWSLGVEFWFCILMPWILMLTKRVNIRTIMLTSIVISLAMRGLHAHWIVTSGIRSWNDLDPLMNNLIIRQSEFVIGMGLAFAYVRGEKIRFPIGRLGILMIFVACVFMDAVPARQFPLIAAEVSYFLPDVGLGLILYAVVSKERSWTKVLLGNWPLRLIGMMCYSLYLWHYPAISVLTPSVNIFRFARYAILVFTLSFLSFRYIEFGWVTNIRSLLPRWHGKPSRKEHLVIVSQ